MFLLTDSAIEAYVRNELEENEIQGESLKIFYKNNFIIYDLFVLREIGPEAAIYALDAHTYVKTYYWLFDSLFRLLKGDKIIVYRVCRDKDVEYDTFLVSDDKSVVIHCSMFPLD